MINKNNMHFFVIQVLSSLSIWLTLVYCFWNIGFSQSLTPIQLGVISFCFSGVMALCNVPMQMLIKPTNAKRIMFMSISIDIIVYALFYTVNLKQNSVYLYIYICIIAACFSSISISRNKIIEATLPKEIEISEIVFKFIRFVGPIVGGVIGSILTFKNMVLLNIILLVFTLVTSLRLKSPITDKILENQCVTHSGNKYKENLVILYVQLVLVFLIAIVIQMVDAQLVTIFHRIEDASISSFGLCIGISGIGVFLVSTYLEKYFVRDIFFYIGFLMMGSLMIFVGIYFTDHRMFPLTLILFMFLVGGISWQVVMTTLENIIKNMSNHKNIMMLFSTIGIILTIAYSLGALSSGFIVKNIGIDDLYLWSGYILFISGGLAGLCVGIYSYIKRKK